jgi:hypothetical protein
VTERSEALAFSARRLASAADVLWLASLTIAIGTPLVEIIFLSRVPLAGLLLALIVLPVGWAARAALMLAVARAELQLEQTNLGDDVDPAASRSTS